MVGVPKLLKDPLTHFLAIGAVFYFVASGTPAPEPEPARIIVDRAALLEFIQYRSKAFDPEAAGALLKSMNAERREQLIKDYVEEEALYREAKAMGLEADDYVIKQRLVQKIGFLSEASLGEIDVTDDEIAAYFDANKNDYAIPPTATFAHIFFNAETRGEAAATAEAARMTTRLNRRRARFEDAVKYGDRFPFHTNYVERTYDYVASQFGADAADAIFNPEGPFNAWRGPVVSPYGAHVIVVTDVTPGRLQTLDEVRDRVVEDATREKRQRLVNEIAAGAIARYEIIVDLAEPDETASKPTTTAAAVP